MAARQHDPLHLGVPARRPPQYDGNRNKRLRRPGEMLLFSNHHLVDTFVTLLADPEFTGRVPRGFPEEGEPKTSNVGERLWCVSVLESVRQGVSTVTRPCFGLLERKFPRRIGFVRTTTESVSRAAACRSYTNRREEPCSAAVEKRSSSARSVCLFKPAGAAPRWWCIRTPGEE